MTPTTLFIGLVAGAFGVGYFMYGKKQAKFTPMFSGIALCVYPYFFDSILWLVVIGAALLAAPFVFDF